MRDFAKNLSKAFFVSFLIATIISLLVGAIVYQRISEYDIDKEAVSIDSTNTVIYDKHGNKIAEFEKDSKEMNYYEEIPEEFIEAAVATEDREFFDHAGVSPESLFRAVLVNIRAGGFAQGGSTITQQLVKEIYLDPGKTIDRKLREWILATIVEKKFTKKEIISYYLNHNFYGYRAYGIESAVHTFYGQSLKEFEEEDAATKAAKAAFLIGVPNAPSYFDPYENPGPTLQRRNTVLTNMYIEGYINEKVYNQAKDMDLLVVDDPNTSSESEKVYYPEFVYYVLSEASKEMEVDVEDIMYSGHQIYTSFDPEVYDVLREKMSDGDKYPYNPSSSDEIQGAAVLVNPQNGEIYALTGAKEETEEFLVLNRAFQSQRQPGSSFKPLISYGPALESGKFTRYSMMSCQSTFGDYTVRDYSCYGSMTMQEALRNSRNATAVWVLQQVGINYARDYVSKLGIELSDNDIYLPIALGGLESGVTPLEMADAFQVFANDGKRTDAHSIRRIVSSENQVLYEPKEPKQTINADNANQMKEMLQIAVHSGTGTSAIVPGTTIAGKTGTNEMPNGNGNKDLWFVGFDEQVVGSIWMGYDNTTGTNFIPAGKTSSYPARMFSSIVSGVLPKLSETDKASVDELELDIYLMGNNSQTQLKWNDLGEMKYQVYKDGKLIGDSFDGEFKDNMITSGQSPSYKVIGYSDKNGEKKVESQPIQISIP